LDQLQDLDGVGARGMFGGHGLYQDETFFGIIHNAASISKRMSTQLRHIEREK
jgi:TfoX/Sxy family transcriptional regulator of competence genes